MSNIKYIGPVFDHSGYGEASRNYVLSLHKSGCHNLTVRPQCFEKNPPPVANSKDLEILKSLVNKKINYDIVIVHLTPDLYPRFREPRKYNIGMFAWETNKVHPVWVETCNDMDELWVPSDYNKEAVINSGITTEAFVVPHGICPDTFSSASSFSLPNVSPTTYKFYSIFQWNYRKNPEGLIRGYLNSFSAHDDVVLILKTYVGGGGMNEIQALKERIKWFKADVAKRNSPRICLISSFLSTSDILGLHLFGDCLVSPHRGEGWGLSPFEAGLAGNPVIVTGYSGNMQFTNEENSYLVKYQENFVSNMLKFNRWYKGEQLWAEPNIKNLSELMLHVYNNREEAGEKGKKLKQNIINNFSWEKIVETINLRLKNLR